MRTEGWLGFIFGVEVSLTGWSTAHTSVVSPNHWDIKYCLQL
jgi:hypothetical protein